MPLIVEDVLDKGILSWAGFSPIFIRVPSKYLSEPFEITYLEEVYARARILQVEPVGRVLPPSEKEVVEKHLIGREVRLRINPGLFTGMDYLYFSEEDWSALRDAAVLPREFSIKLEIYELVFRDLTGVEKKRLPVYPLRNVVVKT